MVLPVVKLLALTVKTVSKPIAKSIQRTVVSHPSVRDVAVDATQRYYKFVVHISRRLYSDSEKVVDAEVKKLSEERALKMFGETVSEVIIYAVAVGLVVFEYQSGKLGAALSTLLRHFRLRLKECRGHACRAREGGREEGQGEALHRVGELAAGHPRQQATRSVPPACSFACTCCRLHLSAHMQCCRRRPTEG
eukprot:scaffold4516_cov417-Prasinococcus_capsulatus_cf.AAC.10